MSRNNKSFIEKYYPIAEQLKKWSIDAVIDGEIMVIKETEPPGFSALQNWRSEADGYLACFLCL
ncbi:hypothetical protein GCM10011518_42160 [Flavobacterium limi]|uniref:ATP-dependent DNA ligase family profile domain-containing protein n=1 Tax=Flavobacterium limi TaxID=2045105 RepID=A0ABQ1UW83_9FLAO|nr:hypothetical protein GCM10011518_42160 [Flavobacterium limi]